MTQNLDNALHGIQEARCAIMVETGNPLNSQEQEDTLEDMQIKINEVEDMIKVYGK